MSPWSRLCVSQADCVLLVAAPDASPEVRPDYCYFSVWLCWLLDTGSCAAACSFRNTPVHMYLWWILTQGMICDADGQSGTAAAVGDH
jgi:hypothetical protein